MRTVAPWLPRGGRRPFRLLHTSDVHLGAYDRGSGRDSAVHRLAVEANLRAVIDVGLRERADLVVIAGDFFDNARVNEETLRFAAEQIARADVPVVIGPGNHDHVGDNSDARPRRSPRTSHPGFEEGRPRAPTFRW